MIPINKDTNIDVGMLISKNFLLEHVSAGAYHPIMGSWAPLYSSKLIPSRVNQIYSLGASNIPLWRVARNLQVGAEGILENLLNAFGGDLIIQSGFLNNVSPENLIREGAHMIGSSFDIQIRGYEDNMYNVANEIQKIAYNASKMQMVFSNNSWLHMEFDERRISSNPLVSDLPQFETVDLISNVVETGITSIRGFV